MFLDQIRLQNSKYLESLLRPENKVERESFERRIKERALNAMQGNCEVKGDLEVRIVCCSDGLYDCRVVVV